MSDAKPNDFYRFDTEVLRYESHLNSFNESLFAELDEQSKKVDLSLKIQDLINGKIVNYSENQAAFHPKYRNENFISIPDELQAKEFKNIVIGINSYDQLNEILRIKKNIINKPKNITSNSKLLIYPYLWKK